MVEILWWIRIQSQLKHSWTEKMVQVISWSGYACRTSYYSQSGFILTVYSLVAYWSFYLDQTILTNAYIGGLKEDIYMKGNDFVVMFSIGNIIFQIPFIYVLYAVPLNFALPTIALYWSVLTIGLSQFTNVGQLKVLRFFVGALKLLLILLTTRYSLHGSSLLLEK